MLVFDQHNLGNGCHLRNSHQDTGTRSKSTQQVTGNGESTNASTTESSSSWNDTLQLLVHALLSVASHDESLILELLSNVAWAGARNLDPSLGENGACNEHVYDVDSGVDWVEKSIGEVQRGRHVVCETGNSEELSRSFLCLPDTEELDKKVLAESGVEHLTDEEDVGGES